MNSEKNTIHHIEFHTINPNSVVDLFVHTYGFQLVAQRITPDFRQWWLKSYECHILVSSVKNADVAVGRTSIDKHYNILPSIVSDQTTRDLILNRDTVFNIAICVKSVQSILDKNPEVKVLVPLQQAKDEYGFVEYACIKSCVGNVVHALIDLSNYSGPWLPGFVPVSIVQNPTSGKMIIKRIDHVAFAMGSQTALTSIAWYEKVFGTRRFYVNREDDPCQGFSVRVDQMGMRLFAMESWYCAQKVSVNNEISSIKLVFSESLIANSSGFNDQITAFIAEHHNQAGIQHIGFECKGNIKDAVRISKMNGAEFLSPPADYYLEENNGHIITNAGEDVNELAELGILLDEEYHDLYEVIPYKTVLLQIFTKSIFNNDTFFLEMIERRGATGFGAGNIRALWKIVQRHMNYSS